MTRQMRTTDKKKEVGTKKVLNEAVLFRSQPSISVNRDAKGIYKFEVKVYADTIEECETKAKATVESMSKFIDRLNHKGRED